MITDQASLSKSTMPITCNLFSEIFKRNRKILVIVVDILHASVVYVLFGLSANIHRNSLTFDIPAQAILWHASDLR